MKYIRELLNSGATVELYEQEVTKELIEKLFDEVSLIIFAEGLGYLTNLESLRLMSCETEIHSL